MSLLESADMLSADEFYEAQLELARRRRSKPVPTNAYEQMQEDEEVSLAVNKLHSGTKE